MNKDPIDPAVQPIDNPTAQSANELGQPNWDQAAEMQPGQADWRQASSGPLRSDPHSGPWKKGRALVILPGVTQLPMNCIFSNQPVTNQTKMLLEKVEKNKEKATLNEIVTESLVRLTYGKVISTILFHKKDKVKSYNIPLPVHRSYFDRLQKLESIMCWTLYGIGAICLIVGSIIFQFANRSAYDDPYYGTGFTIAMVGMVIFAVGLYAQFENKKRKADSQRTLKAVWLGKAVAIPKVHPDILSKLSEFPG